jgi:hypothetical protein
MIDVLVSDIYLTDCAVNDQVCHPKRQAYVPYLVCKCPVLFRCFFAKGLWY